MKLSLEFIEKYPKLINRGVLHVAQTKGLIDLLDSIPEGCKFSYYLTRICLVVDFEFADEEVFNAFLAYHATTDYFVEGELSRVSLVKGQPERGTIDILVNRKASPNTVRIICSYSNDCNSMYHAVIKAAELAFEAFRVLWIEGIPNIYKYLEV
jgi:hypothetical protein